jgi:dephospho-CoA kinase
MKPSSAPLIDIGLTGGIASGKSSAARHLAELGAYIIDADQLAREAVALGSAGLEAIAARFGPGVLAADGGLDRRAMAARIFANETERKALNAIVHPQIRALAEAEARAHRKQILIFDAPLLLELGWQSMVKMVWLISAPEATRIARLKKRDALSEQEATRRIQAQMPEKEKRALADLVFENDGDLAALFRRVEEEYNRVRCGALPRAPLA